MRKIDYFIIERLYIEKAENMSIETLMEILAQHRAEQDHEVEVTIEIHTNGEPVMNIFGFKTKYSITRQLNNDKEQVDMLNFVDLPDVFLTGNTPMEVFQKRRDVLKERIVVNTELLKNLEETEE